MLADLCCQVLSSAFLRSSHLLPQGSGAGGLLVESSEAPRGCQCFGSSLPPAGRTLCVTWAASVLVPPFLPAPPNHEEAGEKGSEGLTAPLHP